MTIAIATPADEIQTRDPARAFLYELLYAAHWHDRRVLQEKATIYYASAQTRSSASRDDALWGLLNATIDLVAVIGPIVVRRAEELARLLPAEAVDGDLFDSDDYMRALFTEAGIPERFATNKEGSEVWEKVKREAVQP